MRLIKRRIARMLTAPFVGKVVRRLFRERVPGSGCVTSTRGVDDRTVATIMFGFYEAAERRFVHRYLPRDIDVVELGGSLGIVTKAILQRTAETRRVVTVEADALLAKSLAERFAGAARVEVVHAAIDCSGAGEVTQFSRGSDNLSGRLGDGNAVTRRSLSQIIEERGLESFALVCDIEGAEAGLLIDDAAGFCACRHVIIETHETTYKGTRLSTSDFRARFAALGFRTIAQHGPVFALTRDA